MNCSKYVKLQIGRWHRAKLRLWLQIVIVLLNKWHLYNVYIFKSGQTISLFPPWALSSWCQVKYSEGRWLTGWVLPCHLEYPISRIQGDTNGRWHFQKFYSKPMKWIIWRQTLCAFNHSRFVHIWLIKIGHFVRRHPSSVTARHHDTKYEVSGDLCQIYLGEGRRRRVQPSLITLAGDTAQALFRKIVVWRKGVGHWDTYPWKLYSNSSSCTLSVFICI